MEKIHRFDHERIPERIVHARGAGAHGHFHVFDDKASKYTFAPVLTDPSRSTPVFVRFSTVQGPRGRDRKSTRLNSSHSSPSRMPSSA